MKMLIRDMRAGEELTPNDYLVDHEVRLIQSLPHSARLKDAAKHNRISEGTAKVYATQIYQKLKIHCLADLVIWAVKFGLISKENIKEITTEGV